MKKENGQVEGQEVQEVQGQETATVPTASKQKWFEAENAFPFATGEQLVVIAGPSLINRRVLVEKPSAKKEALKCFLVNSKTGDKQGTLITMDFAKLRKLTDEEAAQPYPAPVAEEATETPATEAEVVAEAV